MISEAAYYLAEQRGFLGGHSLGDWLAAEQQVRQLISPVLITEVTVTAFDQKQPKPGASPGEAKLQDASRFEKFPATQAAGDGIQRDMLKRNMTTVEKIAANMADRK